MGDGPVGRLKGFATTSLKLGVAITIAFIAVGAICAVGYWVYSYPERQQAKAAEVVRDWSTDLSSNLGMKLRARTKVTDGRMHAALNFDGHPHFLDNAANHTRGFNLEWKDADGFTRIHKFLPLSEFTTRLDDKGKSYGLTGEFSAYVSVADYSAAASLSVGWTFDTDPNFDVLPRYPFGVKPAPKPAPQPTGRASSDHCAPGLTREERLQRLAQRGTVRETGYNTFSVGSHGFTLSGDEVIHCN